MGKPRLIILIRHAQSEGNKNREIHQSIPDHRVKLTQEGQKQALEAGRRLRALLRPEDTLHFFTSPYCRTRETTEGILKSLTSDDPSPSPFPRNTIKVYEEPRLREQDFGNFQPCSAEMERMWQERADYGHFFYRIPNGESAADAYDRISGFNESLWRLFGEESFASVCVLVTHGLMTRIFLMKWYHFSVEYFEDLRNVNHCEFVIMKKNDDDGKYVLQNNLRTWSELRRERERGREREREQLSKGDSGAVIGSSPEIESPIPIRRKWGGCPNGCNHSSMKFWRRRPQRQQTKDILEGNVSTYGGSNDIQAIAVQDKPGSYLEVPVDKASTTHPYPVSPTSHSSSPNSTPSYISLNLHLDSNSQLESLSEELNRDQRQSSTFTQDRRHSNICPSHHLGGRDGGGSESGVTSRATSENENDNVGNDNEAYMRIAASLKGSRQGHVQHQLHNNDRRQGRGIANSLGDRDDDDDDSADHSVGKHGVLIDDDNDGNDSDNHKNCLCAGDELGEEGDALFEKAIQHDRSIQGAVY
ncbi:phosphoglycerate mutase [Histoplasma capsulatum var. duboisii H88]|uniref:Phosphoglycerate mutase n=1 Tax=Ajellomyces capsulatus (strain H88) TaxID=544711 RepID=A0A8A1LJN8_AJEC8|nr:phosphoglycerate mutase [Histoplasma capsulatum var. duboisii H88]